MKQNILFFFTDQQRWDTAGCYGQELPVTPNLDRMADQGVRFEHAFTCQPVCGPARACIQTGKYATEMGTFKNGKALPREEKTIAHYMNDAGYETAYVGKWHLASEEGGCSYETTAVPEERRGGYKDYWMVSDMLELTSHGYDGYVFDKENRKVTFEGYRADCITDFALDYIRKPKERPYFLMVSYIEPHHQNDNNHFEGPKGCVEEFRHYKVPGDLTGTGGDWRGEYPDYLGCCNRLDYNLGRIMDELEKTGQLENTIIIYGSDHGCHFRTRNVEYKRSCHDSCIRIPLVIQGGEFSGGKVVDDLVSLIDLPPTFLKMAGIEKPKQMKGNQIQKLMDVENADWPKAVFMQISEDKVGRAIRTERYKYAVMAPDKDGQNDSNSLVYEEDYLYDLHKDPHERNNLVNSPDYKEICKELSKLLIEKMDEAGEERPQILPCSHINERKYGSCW